jgi:aminomethyltransferase
MQLKLKDRYLPVNLRQSGNPNLRMLVGTRVRKSPYFHKSLEHGCWAVTVYNEMYHPRAYFPPEADGLLGEYYYLTHNVTLWNVAVERQIQIKGPDALEFADLLTTRDLKKKAPVNQARYVILCDEKGGIINDPVLLRIAEDEIWLSISDSDVVLWAKGVNYGLKYDVEINQIDAAPVQVQGPYSRQVMKKLFGDAIDGLKYYKLWHTTLDGMNVVVSRTGFSAEVGYEIYLHDATVHADKLWDRILEAGEEFDIRVIAPGHIRRIEGGILSYGQDMDIENNPFEVGLDWQVDFSKENFIGKEALWRIKQKGVQQKLVGLTFGGPRVSWYNPDFWLVLDKDGEKELGYITSAFYSPKLGTNIALAMMPIDKTETGTRLSVRLPEQSRPIPAEIHSVPFYDPGKEIPAS